MPELITRSGTCCDSAPVVSAGGAASFRIMTGYRRWRRGEEHDEQVPTPRGCAVKEFDSTYQRTRVNDGIMIETTWLGLSYAFTILLQNWSASSSDKEYNGAMYSLLEHTSSALVLS